MTISAEERRERRWRRYRDEIAHLNSYIDLFSSDTLAVERVQHARERLAWIEHYCEHGPTKARRLEPAVNPLQAGWHPRLRPHEPVAQWQIDILMELARALSGQPSCGNND